MSAWVYVLHFQRPLAHAEHYSGCTRNLRGRLTTHALGHGSRLTKELYAQGIEWELGGLFACNVATMRRIERTLKDQHNGGRFCRVCEGMAVPAGSTAYDVANVPGWGNSLAVRCTAGTYHDPGHRLRCTNENDIVLCDEFKELMHANGEELGFIPVGGTGGLNGLLATGNIVALWCQADKRLAGYLAFTRNRQRRRARIHQLVVRDEHRRRGYGRAMLALLQNAYPMDMLTANVKASLPACAFWEAQGFKEEISSIHLTSASKITYYVRHPFTLLGD